MSRILTSLTIALSLASAAGTTAMAGGQAAGDAVVLPPIPISGPTVITRPGSYVVVADIVGLNAGRCVISIGSDDVDLDLGGFALDALDGWGVCAYDVSGVSVRNGKIQVGSSDDEGEAINFRNVSGFAIRSMTVYTVEEDAVRLYQCERGVVEGNQVIGWTDGMGVSGSDVVIRRNVVNGGIRIYGERIHLVDNTVLPSQLAGLGLAAINVSGRWNRVIGNVAGNGWISSNASRNLILNNVFSASRGMEVQGQGNRIIGNTFARSSRFGLWFSEASADNVYSRNTAIGNNGEDCANPEGNSDFCDEGLNNRNGGGNYLPDPQ